MNLTVHANDTAVARDFTNLSSNEQNVIREKMKAGVQRTKITFKNHDTGETLGEFENKIVISGSQFNATSAFGIDDAVDIPTYNTEMELDNSDPTGTTPANNPIVCLFCVADSGCGSTPKDVYTTNYVSRLKPAPANPTSKDDFTSDMIMPFRFVDITDDLDEDHRQYYFGRKTFETLGKIGYYFKSFDSDPVLHLRYADGTLITSDLYNNESTQSAECYIEMRLRMTRLDFRDYFEQILGWDKARISSLSLVFAWYDTKSDTYKYYQDITAYSVLNFSYMSLVSADTAIDVIYDIYF